MSNFNKSQIVKIIGANELLMNVYQNHGENGLRNLINEIGVNEKYASSSNIFEICKILIIFNPDIVENAINTCVVFKTNVRMIERLIGHCKYELVNLENDDHVGGDDWGSIREWVEQCISSGTKPQSIIRLA